MDFEVLDSADDGEHKKWSHLWSQWAAREVFAHPNYLRLFCADEDRALCAVLTSEAGTALYPFILRRVPNTVDQNTDSAASWDTISPYGYGGAVQIAAADNSELASQFWSHFEAWCRTNDVVAEFVRFSLFPESLLNYPGESCRKQDNVVRSLDIAPESLWMDFDHKVRKNVKKAQRLGVVVDVDTTGARFDDFYRIYQMTMDRKAASESYYFSENFFRSIHSSLPGQFAYFHARNGQHVISTELVLVSAESVYSFLGGTDSSAFDMRPNELLKFEIMNWAAQQGKKHFVLGGGYEPDDGIFKYKKAFAPSGVVPFYVGQRVYDSAKYAQLVNGRNLMAAREGIDVAPDFFPAYRG